jgi:hypothetical protein
MNTLPKLILLFCLMAASAYGTTIIPAPGPPNEFDPGNMCLIVGTPRDPGHTVISDFILRTPRQQQAALTSFNAFPAGTLDAGAGIVVILKPQFHIAAAKMSALGLTVGNLDALHNWSSGIFAGVIGIDAPDVLAFGGSNFIDDVGIAGAPVSFYLQTYDHTGLYANQFVSETGLDAGYRLGFTTEPNQPFEAPEGGNTIGLLSLALFSLAVPSRKLRPELWIPPCGGR